MAAEGSSSNVSTRLSSVTSVITLSILLLVRIALILVVSITGETRLVCEERFKTMAKERSPGKTFIVEVFVSFTHEAIHLGVSK